jgi:hypothetical protein
MAVNWTAEQIQYGSVTQIIFKVIDTNKSMGINGSIEGSPETDDLVQWVKDSIGNDAVQEYETEAQNIDDSIPEFPFPV